jgi:hypothetical protein
MGGLLYLFIIAAAAFGEIFVRNRLIAWGDAAATAGILLAIAGCGYVAFSLAQILSPVFAARVMFPWVFPFSFVAEAALSLWLLVKGVDIPKWNERTQA